MKYITNQEMMSRFSEAYWFLYRHHLTDFKSLFFTDQVITEDGTTEAIPAYILTYDGKLLRLIKDEQTYKLEQVTDINLYLLSLQEAHRAGNEYPSINHTLFNIERVISNKQLINLQLNKLQYAENKEDRI